MYKGLHKGLEILQEWKKVAVRLLELFAFLSIGLFFIEYILKRFMSGLE
ncbi:hypothetical protein ACFQ3N_15090 [Virgibacillus byunsanensis]|uniref:Stage III sporulation protein AC n=1 Tax=Virgibacillus byunsanensis TaxID=570945 RepID=A0ABW3LMU6_9BACI